MKPIIIMGAGGHARVLIEALLQSGREIAGLVDPTMQLGAKILGVQVIGNDETVYSFKTGEIELVNAIGVLPGKNDRWQLAARMRGKKYRFSQVIHPTAIIASDVILEDGVQIMAGAILQPGVSIGQDTIVNTGVIIDHDCRVKSNCHLSPGVILSGGVVVGEGAFVGTGTSIIQGITIGPNNIIGAGSVIFSDIPANMVCIQPRNNKLLSKES